MKLLKTIWKRWFKSKIPGQKPAGKYTLELNYPGDSRVFINFWDWSHGNNVCCRISEYGLLLQKWNDDLGVMQERKITFNTFLQMIEESIGQQGE